MILITAVIKEQEDGCVIVRFNGQDIQGNTDLEADIADALGHAMVTRRDEIFSGKGWKAQPIKQTYSRASRDPRRGRHDDKPTDPGQ